MRRNPHGIFRSESIRGVLVVLSTTLVLCSAAAALELVNGGEGLGPVVIPAGASAQVRSVAEEMADYLRRVTGAEWTVRSDADHRAASGIFIGSTAQAAAAGVSAEGLKAEGFRVRSAGEGVFIVGADDAGTCFGVYDFLEDHCGVRWYAPGRLGEVVPKKPRLRIPELDYAEEPDFVTRSVWLCWGQKIPKQKFARYAEWARHNRMGGRRMMMGHNLNSAFPPALHEKHPDLFPLIDGRRFRPDRLFDWQPCTSNPEVVRRVVADARRYFDAYPHEWMYSISPLDGFGWCECNACRALDPPAHRSDKRFHKAQRFVPFANAVADEIAKSHPDRVVGFYAYLGVLDPPAGMKLRDNVVVGVCRYGRAGDNYHPIDSPEDVSPACAYYRRIIEGWGKVAKQLAAREYFTVLVHPNDALERCAQAAHIARDIRYYRNNGFVAISSQSAPEWGSAGLNYYLAARLMWDADQDADALLDDYYAGFYGPAARHMRSYFEICQRLAIRGRELKKNLFDAQQITALQQHLDKAAAAAGDTVVGERVALARDLFKLWRMGRELAPVDAPGSAEAARRYLEYAKSLREGDAIAYTHFEYSVLRPPELPNPSAPASGFRVVLSEQTPVADAGPCAWLRGASRWFILAGPGEKIGFRIQQRRLGRQYLSPLVYQVVDPGGGIRAKGEVSLGQAADVEFAAETAGVYTLHANAGINSYYVRFGAHRVVLDAENVHLHQRGQRFYFLVPKDCAEFSVSLRGEWAEAARLRVFAPGGQVRFDGETDADASCLAKVKPVADEKGKVWSLLVSEPRDRVFDDAYLSILSGVPKCLSTNPANLIIPVHE